MEKKTATLNLRVSPELKQMIRTAADQEHRTVANFIEVLVRAHCAEHGIAVESKPRQTSAKTRRGA